MSCSNGVGLSCPSSGPIGLALGSFDGPSYGEEYVSLVAGEQIERLLCRDEDGGWAFGRRIRDGACGWFPSSYWGAGNGASKTHSSSLDVGGTIAASEGPRYDRFSLLRVGLALRQTGSPPAAGDPMCTLAAVAGFGSHEFRIGMGVRPQEETRAQPVERRFKALDDVISTLVELAGGKAKIGNLAAAGLALGIMTGGHSKVCQEILAAVRLRPDIFCPIPDSTESSKLMVTLRS